MKLYYILPALLFILLAPAISHAGTWCYQEFANQSTSCGGLSTGTYQNVSLEWASSDSGAYAIDGNWTTSSYDSRASDNEPSYIYINYTKHPQATNLSLWQTKEGNSLRPQINVTINQSCWSWNATKLSLRAVSLWLLTAENNLSWECWNGTTWMQTKYNASTQGILEEGMYWYIPGMSSTSPTNSTYAYRNISLNFTPETGYDKCWYTLNTTANISLTNCQNTTRLFNNGYYNITYYYNSTSGQYYNTSTTYFTVYNNPPEIVSATITPTPAYRITKLYANATIKDNQTTTLLKIWWKLWNGTSLYSSGSTGYTLANNTQYNLANISANVTWKTEVWRLEIKGDDGVDNGTASNSTAVTILDSDPRISSVTLTPSPSFVTNALYANTTGLVNTSSLLKFHWKLWNGTSVYSSGSTSYIYANNTQYNIINLTAGIARKGQSWKYETKADDGSYNSSALNSSTLTINNSNPTIPTGLSLTQAYVNVDMTATGSGSTDADSETLTYYYEFHDINNSHTFQAYSSDSTYTPNLSQVSHIIRVRTIAGDGSSNTTWKESNSTVLVTYPSLTLVSPINTSYSQNAALTFYITSSSFTTDKCWYSNDTHNNISLSNCNNISSLPYSLGQHKIKAFANTTDNYRFNSTEINFTYVGIQIRMLDEDTLAELNNVYAVFSNSTYSLNTDYFNGTKLLNQSTIPTGSVILQAFYGSIMRQITMYLNASSSINITVYFPSSYSYYTFQTKSTDLPLPNSTITIRRYLTGTGNFETLINGTTGIDGEIGFYAKPNVIHKITASHEGYQSQEFDQIFNSSSYIIITMLPSSNLTIPINTFIDPNITYTLTPESPYVNTSTTTRLVITDTASLIDWISLNITYMNYTNISQHIQYYYSNITGTRGGSFNVSLNDTGMAYYRATIYRNGETLTIGKNYIVGNWTNTFDAEYIDQTGGPSVTFWKIAAFFLMVVIVGLLWKFIGVAVLFLVPILMAVFTLWHIFSIGECILVILVSLASIRIIMR